MHREMFGVDGHNYGDACLVSGGPPAASRGIDGIYALRNFSTGANPS